VIPNGSKFYFSKLTDGEKNLYTHISDAISRFEPALSLHAGMGRDFTLDIEKILTAVFFDNPGYFYLDRNRIAVKRTPMYLQLCFAYDYTQTEAEKLSTQIKEKVAAFMAECIEPKMSPLAKQLSVHQYIQKTVKPQTSDYDKDSFSVVGALLRGSCVCEGFAKAYKLLCDYLRIASVIVTGQATREGQTANHAWNITRINGVTAHSDITWDTIAGVGSYDYFNLCDADIAADHTFDAALYPKCNPNKINYFYKNSLIAANEDETKKIVARNADRDFFSVKCLFPVTKDQLPALGFPPGRLRFNETQNVIACLRAAAG
jgi:transglutaminase/protease-like cytokinesis protein 3